jgi:hypothetical protein
MWPLQQHVYNIKVYIDHQSSSEDDGWMDGWIDGWSYDETCYF